MARRNWAKRFHIKLRKMDDAASGRDDWEKRSIYKLATSLTDLNKKAYIPQAVSFGPYHNGEHHLLPMEEHKVRALLHFLNRSEKSLQELIDCLKEKEEDLKSAYTMLPTKYQQDGMEFIGLMILDGCFMFEILDNYNEKLERYPNDPIFSYDGMRRMIPYIKPDMLMLENQLPMLLLEKLLAFKSGQQVKQDDKGLNQLIRELFFSNVENPPALGKCLHVLDVYRKILWGEHQGEGGDGRSQEGDERSRTIPSATELNLAGIRFSLNETGSLKNISFDHRTLKLPPIHVDDDTESIFLNLIAYERYHIGTGNQEITSYIYFMDRIIDTEKDVALLKSRNIVRNFLGSDNDVAKLFNSLAKDITLDPHSKLNEVLFNVQKQYGKPWSAWRTYLITTVDFFKNRWAFLSLVAAVIIFALTMTQTVYTVFAYYKNDSPRTPPALPPPPPPMIPPPPRVISRRLSSYRHL